MHTAYNSTYLIRAAVVCTGSKGTQYAIWNAAIDMSVKHSKIKRLRTLSKPKTRKNGGKSGIEEIRADIFIALKEKLAI